MSSNTEAQQALLDDLEKQNKRIKMELASIRLQMPNSLPKSSVQDQQENTREGINDYLHLLKQRDLAITANHHFYTEAAFIGVIETAFGWDAEKRIAWNLFFEAKKTLLKDFFNDIHHLPRALDAAQICLYEDESLFNKHKDLMKLLRNENSQEWGEMISIFKKMLLEPAFNGNDPSMHTTGGMISYFDRTWIVSHYLTETLFPCSDGKLLNSDKAFQFFSKMELMGRVQRFHKSISNAFIMKIRKKAKEVFGDIQELQDSFPSEDQIQHIIDQFDLSEFYHREEPIQGVSDDLYGSHPTGVFHEKGGWPDNAFNEVGEPNFNNVITIN